MYHCQSGSDGSAATTAQKLTAYQKFQDAETVDVGLIMAGNGDATHIDNLITIAENRKDELYLLLQREVMLLMLQTKHTKR